MKKYKLGIGVTGASGAAYALSLLQLTSNINEIETHLVVSEHAKSIIMNEIGESYLVEFEELSDFSYSIGNMNTSLASGSFSIDGMAIIPCSLHSAMSIAAGLAGNLIHRTAQVCLKEKRKLILLLRETPLATNHLQNLAALSNAGAVIMPASPHIYMKPESIDDLFDSMARRVLIQFNIPGFSINPYS